MLCSFNLRLCERDVKYSVIDELIDFIGCFFDIATTSTATGDENIRERLSHLLAVLFLEGSKIVGHDVVDINSNRMAICCREYDKWVHVVPIGVVRFE